LGFTSTQLNSVGGACKFIFNKFRGTGNRMHQDDYESVIRQYAPFAHQYFDVGIGMPQEIYNPSKRTATLSVALATFRFSAQVFGFDKISDFWHGVLFDDGIANGDPRKVVYRHLLTVGMAGGVGNGIRKTSQVSAQYSARYIANCFNAYIEKRSLKQTMVADQTSSIKILGTPFTGKE